MGSRMVMVKRWLSDRWGWVVTAACCVLFFINFGFMLVFSIVFVALQEEFGSTATQTAWVGSIPIGFCDMCSPLVNLLIERFRYRAVVASGVAISAAGIIVTSFMPALAPMYFTFSLTFGLGTGMVMFASFKLLLAYFPVKNSVRALAMPMGCSNIGMFTLGPLTYLLQTRYGWRNMLRVMGSLIGLMSLPLCLAFTPPPNPEKDPQRAETFQKPSETDRMCSAPSSTRYSEITTSIIDDDEEDQRVIKEKSKDDCSRLHIQEENGKVGSEGDIIDDTKIMRRECEAANQLKEELIQTESSRSLIWRTLCTLKYPDVVLFSFSVFGYGLVNSFVIIQMGNFMLSIGHTEESGSQVVIAIGVSIMVGKIVLVLFADVAPFPKLGFFLIASLMGIAILVCLLYVHNLIFILAMTALLGVTVMSTADCLPYSICNHAFGVALGTQALPIVAFFHGSGFMLASLLGESVDRTGSYDTALYACIGVYALCGLFCLLVPVYQQCFVQDRFIMDIQFGWKKRGKTKMEEVKSPWTYEEVAYMITDRVSIV